MAYILRKIKNTLNNNFSLLFQNLDVNYHVNVIYVIYTVGASKNFLAHSYSANSDSLRLNCTKHDKSYFLCISCCSSYSSIIQLASIS
jgi:hypothetical protein